MKGFWRRRRRLRGQPAQVLLGRRGHRGQRLRFDYLPRLTGDHGTYQTVHGHDRRQGRGLLPARPEPRRRLGARADAAARHGAPDWLVVRDLPSIETRDLLEERARRSRPGSCVTEDIGTEVFFLPAASHVEKDGTFTQTQRVLQWHHKAVEPPGDCPQRAAVLLPPRPQDPRAAGRLHPRARPPAARPRLGLPRRRDRRPVRRGGAEGDQRGPPHRRQGRPAAVQLHRDEGPTARPPAAAGSTPASTPTASTRPPGASPGTRAVLGGPGVGLGVADRTAACSTTAPRPTPRASRGASARPTSGGTRSSGRWTGHDVPDFEVDKPPSYRPPEGAGGTEGLAGDDPFIMQGDGKGWLLRADRAARRAAADALRAGRVAGSATRSTRQQANPTRAGVRAHGQPAQPLRAGAGHRGLPVRLHDVPADRAPHGRRDEPLAAVPLRAAAGVLLRGLPRAGRASAGWSTWAGPRSSRARSAIEAPGDGHRPARAAAASRAGGSTRSACPTTGASAAALVTGDSANDLFGITLDPNVHIQETKVASCDIRPGRRPDGPGAAAPGQRLLCPSRHHRRHGQRPAHPTAPGATPPPKESIDEHPVVRFERPGPRRRVAGPAGAQGLLHRHLDLHRLQGLRGGLQGVERDPRGRPVDARLLLRQHRRARCEHLAARRVHRAAQAARAPAERRRPPAPSTSVCRPSPRPPGPTAASARRTPARSTATAARRPWSASGPTSGG